MLVTPSADLCTGRVACSIMKIQRKIVIYLAVVTCAVFSPHSASGQQPASSPTPEGSVPGSAITEEVVVTGSNIPTSEEVGPNPVDTYRKEDILRFGATTFTDFLQKLPDVTGFSVNENVNNNGDGRSEV